MAVKRAALLTAPRVAYYDPSLSPQITRSFSKHGGEDWFLAEASQESRWLR